MEADIENSEEIEVVYLDDFGNEVLEEVENEQFSEEDENFEIIDCSKVTFSNHSKSVFCGDLSKDGDFAATGGEDDSAYIWSTSDGAVKFECTGHKDSITSVCFNYDNNLLATGDMFGMIQVWDVQNLKLVWCYEGDDMEWLIWHPLTNVLLSGSHSGEIYIWQVPQGNCKVLASHGSPCTCGKLLPDGKNILTGYEDGQLKLWDIKQSSMRWQFSTPEKSSLTSIEINADGTLCSIAPSSELIKVADGKCISKLLLQGEADIEAHMFSTELNLLVTGALSGQICVWDLSTQMIRHQAKLDFGITILKLGLNGQAFVGSTDGAVYVCDIRTGVLANVLTGHRASILSMCLSNNLKMLTTSDDKTAKIFSIV